jgi:hypothetical protein
VASTKLQPNHSSESSNNYKDRQLCGFQKRHERGHEEENPFVCDKLKPIVQIAAKRCADRAIPTPAKTAECENQSTSASNLSRYVTCKCCMIPAPSIQRTTNSIDTSRTPSQHTQIIPVPITFRPTVNS